MSQKIRIFLCVRLKKLRSKLSELSEDSTHLQSWHNSLACATEEPGRKAHDENFVVVATRIDFGLRLDLD